MLDKEMIEDLLVQCGTSPALWKGDSMQVCCPVHGEVHPSMGVSYEKQVCHCFSCGFAGNFIKLLVYSLPDDFGYDPGRPGSYYSAYARASGYIHERYGVSTDRVKLSTLAVPRYEELYSHKPEEREVMPLSKLAPFKSGKETYKYFFNRGFTKENMQFFKIGRDTDSRTVTIPVFYSDGKLAGIIGRYIKPRSYNERYKVYSFRRNNVLYPLDKFRHTGRKTAILVEGAFDAIRMFNAGHTDTLSMLGNELSHAQVKILLNITGSVIYLGDNDPRGIEAMGKNIQLLKKAGIKVYSPDVYPDKGKDPCDWTDSQISGIIKSSLEKIIRVRRI